MAIPIQNTFFMDRDPHGLNPSSFNSEVSLCQGDLLCGNTKHSAIAIKMQLLFMSKYSSHDCHPHSVGEI
jgi:hypothetical protein